MGRTYDAVMNAEQQRKRLSRPVAPEDVSEGWETPRSERGLSRWRSWTSGEEVGAPSEAAHAALVEQIASLEVTVGALDDPISRELTEIEQRVPSQAVEDLNRLEDRLSRLIRQ